MSLNEKGSIFDLLLDDAIAVCDDIRKNRKEINNLARIKLELQEKFLSGEPDECEVEITRLYDELGVLLDEAFHLKMDKEDILESIKYYETKIREYEWSSSTPKDEMYYRYREYLFSNTIKIDKIDNKLDEIKDTSKPIRSEIQNCIVGLIGTISTIYPDYLKNDLFTISPKVHISPKRKAFEFAKKDFKLDGKKVYKSFVDSAFEQIDERVVSLNSSLNRDYSKFYETTSKITMDYENGYEVVSNLLRYADGNIKKKDISMKVKKIGSIS